MHQTVSLGTRYGAIEVTATEATHLHVANMPGVDTVIRGKAHRRWSAHMYRWSEDGKWHVGVRDKRGNFALDSTLRADIYGHFYAVDDNMTEHARKLLIAEIEAVVNAWANTNDATRTLRAAEAGHIAEAIDRLERANAKLRTEMTENDAKLRDLRAALKAV